MRLSIIIPVLNEGELIRKTLTTLSALHDNKNAIEVIVVDGGSSDQTLINTQLNTQVKTQCFAKRIAISAAGRAKQMNLGAAMASGDVLVFLHVDTQLTVPALQSIIALSSNTHHQETLWGFFSIRLSGTHVLFRLIEKMINLRSRLSSICTGDQVFFIQRSLFKRIHGFPVIPLMEDVAICKTLRNITKPMCLNHALTTSSRRWETRGIIKTIILMWWLRWCFFIGRSPQHLAQLYR